MYFVSAMKRLKHLSRKFAYQNLLSQTLHAALIRIRSVCYNISGLVLQKCDAAVRELTSVAVAVGPEIVPQCECIVCIDVRGFVLMEGEGQSPYGTVPMWVSQTK